MAPLRFGARTYAGLSQKEAELKAKAEKRKERLEVLLD